MKKFLYWIWNIIIALVIAISIISVITFGVSTNAHLKNIQKQIDELYEISVQGQNIIIENQNSKHLEHLYIMSKISSLKRIVLKEQKEKYNELKTIQEKNKKSSLKQLDSLIDDFNKNQEKINNRFKKEESLPYEYLKKVTVRLFRIKEIDDKIGWLGTGIIIKITEDFTYILTNRHVATIGTHVYVNKNGLIYKVDILKNSAFNDLALVRMNGKFSDKEVVRGFADHKIQEKIYSVGMYLGNHFIYSEGTVAGVNIINDLLVNLPSANGCSGSGIFNSKGEVIGLLYGGYVIRVFTSDTSKAICVPTSVIKVFLREFL